MSFQRVGMCGKFELNNLKSHGMATLSGLQAWYGVLYQNKKKANEKKQLSGNVMWLYE